MRIIDVRTLRGPNRWSVTRQHLIVLQLDLEDYEEKPTNLIPEFLERIKTLLPSLYEHRCSYNEPGGLLKRIEEGTWAGHVIEHLALELQSLAGMEVGFGRTRETMTRGVYNVVFSYFEEEAGRYAGEVAVRTFLDLAEGRPMEEMQRQLAEDIQRLREIREDVRYGPSTGSIVEEAERRGIPVMRLNDQSLIQLGHGVHQCRVQATVTARTNMIAVDLAGDKHATKMMLADMGVPVPKGRLIRSAEEIDEVVKELGFPLAVKPLNANHGRGISVGLRTLEDVRVAVASAQEHYRTVIIEQSITGNDFRALVINKKLVAVAQRQPAQVIGDGTHTVAELIEMVNADPRRGYGHEKALTLIDVNSHTLRVLEKGGRTLETIPAEGETVVLKDAANLSSGGTAIDVTDEVHPWNVTLCERIAKIIGLDVAGIDIVAPDLYTPIAENGGAVVEVNAAPGFRMHLSPSEGMPRNVAEPVIDMLFPPGTPSRIPIVAVTGTNGKTTTTRLVAHIVRSAGFAVGYTTTDGTYVGSTLINKGDNTGPVSAQRVLRDPTVEVAVLETARGGILRSGLGFDACDVGVVMNVSADHMGLRGVNSLEEMAWVKSVVPRAVRRQGYAVLNADDQLVLAMREELDCNIALFSLDENNPHIVEHTARGGLACVLENGWVTVMKGRWKNRINPVGDIPLTYGGRATFMIQNVLAAVLAAYGVEGVKLEDIRSALLSFVPSVAQTPGRLNMIDLEQNSVLIDFAHNPHGARGLLQFVEQLPQKRRLLLTGGTGDRRDEDLIELGMICARIATRAIVREDDDLRGRAPGETSRLLIEGMRREKPDLEIEIVLNPAEAVKHVLRTAQPGELVVIMADDVQRTLDMVKAWRDREGKESGQERSAHQMHEVASQ